MSTPHIDAAPGDFADTVLLPGDPLRAQHIATHWFDHARQVCGLRNMLGYTGRWQGRPLSVIGTGMGMPSLAIYVTELVRMFGARRLIRVGTCGGLQPSMALGELLLALGAGSDSPIGQRTLPGIALPAVCDPTLLRQAWSAADAIQQPVRCGSVFSTDEFYGDPALLPALRAHGMLGIDMETAALYRLAAQYGVHAISLLAVSDLLPDGAAMPAAQRQRALDGLFRLALATAAAG